jgi:signal transduction histidine kinase
MFSLLGKIEDFPLHKRILIFTTFYAVILCVISVFLNLKLHIVLVIVPIIAAIIFSFLFVSAKRTETISPISTTFIVVCIIALTIVWFFNDGYNSSHSLLIFNSLMISIMISPRRRRLLVFLIFAITLTSLIIIQFYYPNLITNYGSEFERFLDILPSTILNLIIMYGLVNYVLNNYDMEQQKVIYERKKVEKVNSELQTKNNLISEQNNKLDSMNKELSSVNEQISKQYQELEDLHSTQKVLNEEIIAKNERLNKLNTDLLEANATKDKFFSIIAHDLKNPLTAIILKSEIVYNYFDKLSNDEKVENIKALHFSSKHLYQFLENLLTWARSQTGKLEFQTESIKFQSLLGELIALYEQGIKNKKINIIFKNTEFVKLVADYNMISTIMRNLISNAVKFSTEGGEIEIGVIEGSNSSQDSYVIIYVRDSGVGMSESTIDKLFQIGKNVSTKGTAGEKGTGLGLILCKEFVEKHGGQIWVESCEGQGSTFYFTIQK